MTLRGVIQDGTIKLSRRPRLPNGTVVEVLLTPVEKKPSSGRAGASNGHANGIRRAKKAGPRRMTRKQRLEAILAGFGRWKDRPDWKGKSSAQIAAELRRKALGDRFA